MAKIKTEAQIENIKYSSQVLAKLLIELKSFVKPNVTLLEIDGFAEDFIMSHKGLPSFKGFQGFPNTTCISVNENVIHGIPTNSPLKEGDIVGVDVGMIYRGGYGDTAYTYAVGEVSEAKKKLMEATEASLYKGIEQAVRGNRVGDISNAIQAFAEAKGYSLVRGYCGHGVGLDVWEEPPIPNVGKKGYGPRLKSGMVIAIEPMVNIGHHEIFVNKDGWTVTTKDLMPSAHYEHTVLIQNGSPQILTRLD